MATRTCRGFISYTEILKRMSIPPFLKSSPTVFMQNNYSDMMAAQSSSSNKNFSSIVKLSRVNGRSNEDFISFSCPSPCIVIPISLHDHQKLCHFFLWPLTSTIENLRDEIKKLEELRIVSIEFLTTEGASISNTEKLHHLADIRNFQMKINGIKYECELQVPKQFFHEINFNEIRNQISSLYEILNLRNITLENEKAIKTKLEAIEGELKPLSELKRQIEIECEKSVQRLFWIGFTALCLQMGVFARLTWWEYSWDIVEPVTYFSTFSTVLITFAYYMMTRQNFEYTSAHSRQMTRCFYRRALKYSFNIEKYNDLCRQRDELSDDLKRLKKTNISQ